MLQHEKSITGKEEQKALHPFCLKQRFLLTIIKPSYGLPLSSYIDKGHV